MFASQINNVMLSQKIGVGRPFHGNTLRAFEDLSRSFARVDPSNERDNGCLDMTRVYACKIKSA